MATNSVTARKEVRSPWFVSLAPWLSRIVMVPPTLIMILIGIRYITNPLHAASPTGVALSTPEALTDTRVAGALALTVAFAIAMSILSFRSLRMGHATVVALMASILAVRLFGFAQDGTTLAMGDQRVKAVGEVLFLMLNTLAFYLQTYVHQKRGVRS